VKWGGNRQTDKCELCKKEWNEKKKRSLGKKRRGPTKTKKNNNLKQENEEKE